jgi:hypothetical protein
VPGRILHADQWAHHGHSEKEPAEIPAYFARFYFMRDEDADLFRWRWLKE